MQIKREDYEALKPFEDIFNRAIKLNFLHLGQSEFNEIMAVYEKYFPALNKSQMNCGSCRLTAVKKLGEAYFAMPEPKKRGRKPKIEDNADNGESESEE